jgi:hypothetical protein
MSYKGESGQGQCSELVASTKHMPFGVTMMGNGLLLSGDSLHMTCQAWGDKVLDEVVNSNMPDI